MDNGDSVYREEIWESLRNRGSMEIDLESLPIEPENWCMLATQAAADLQRPVKTFIDDEYAGAWLTDFPADLNEYTAARKHLHSTVLSFHGEYIPTTGATTPGKPLSPIELDHLYELVELVENGGEIVSTRWRPRMRPLYHWLMLIELVFEYEFGSIWVARDVAEFIFVKPFVPNDPAAVTST